MKITKEKVIYFSVLNLIPFWVAFPFVWLISHAHNYFDVIYFYKALLFILLATSFASFITFYYSYKKRETYKIIHCAFFTSLVLPLFFFCSLIYFILFSSEKADVFGGLAFIIIAFIFCYIFSLIILKITDPLRKKIKW